MKLQNLRISESELKMYMFLRYDLFYIELTGTICYKNKRVLKFVYLGEVAILVRSIKRALFENASEPRSQL